ncbi:DNA mismatch repair endonuclease MutL [Brevibacillus ginsengisoli]|uniref:DNA mismatch repair endonuclease MutL n=1 Tax=Brevibacillus ginsengisoli TaxID=363854 RepID=UPI003CF798D7
MGKIQVLDEHLSNMIAAGEVVERPASVVKELVENSIDASATKIEVHIEEGGLQLIRIIDDGNGMDREDCVIAFERHATSKLRTARDLFQIRTLGFRGEALPSIASVARLELLSSQSSSEVGTKLLIEGGHVKQIEDSAMVRGTQILVRELFYNTPARLKYMKSISTEVGHISDYVNRLALTHPDIAFTLTHNGKALLQTSGDGKMLHVMAAIYGVQIAKLLLPIEGESLDFKWRGFLSKTEVTRSNRSYISTLINGRYVRSNALTAAIMRGYHTLLPIGRYPIAVIDIEMDPTLVDVNVHPSKLEVRFSKEQELCQQIEKSVQSALREGLGIIKPLQIEKKARIITEKPIQPQFDLAPPSSVNRPAQTPTQMWTERVGENRPPIIRKLEPHPDSIQVVRDSNQDGYESASQTWREQTKSELIQSNPVIIDELKEEREELMEPAESMATVESDNPTQSVYPQESVNHTELIDFLNSSDSEEVAQQHPAVPALFPVGQVHGTYIVAQNDNGMYLIDQHAAQERIYYELFMRKLAEETSISQLLLLPHTIECTSAEEVKLKKRLDLLLSLGLEMEWFGNRTFVVRSHPQWFPEGAELEIIDELVQYSIGLSDKETADIRPIREKAAIMMSCKASIKANRYLTIPEMEALLGDLRSTSSPFTCPHGRPIIIHFSSYDLEKMFKRVM